MVNLSELSRNFTIQGLLGDPNPDDALDNGVAQVWIANKAQVKSSQFNIFFKQF